MLLFFNLQSIPDANCPQAQFNVHRRTLHTPLMKQAAETVGQGMEMCKRPHLLTC
jgi:hypothetical protein